MYRQYHKLWYHAKTMKTPPSHKNGEAETYTVETDCETVIHYKQKEVATGDGSETQVVATVKNEGMKFTIRLTKSDVDNLASILSEISNRI